MIRSISAQLEASSKKKLEEFELVYCKLNRLVEQFNEKVSNRVNEIHFKVVEKYKKIIENLTEELNKVCCSFEEVIFEQKEERNFFREQSLLLNNQLKEYEEKNKKNDQKIFMLQTELTNYEIICKDQQREINFLKLEKNEKELHKNNIFINRLERNDNIINNEIKDSRITTNNNFSKNRRAKSCSKIVNENIKSINECENKTFVKKSHLVYKELNPNFLLLAKKREKEEIILHCINTVKKTIHHRSSSFSNNIFDIEKINYKSFTKNDCINLISLILNNEVLLEDFKSFLQAKYFKIENNEKQNKYSSHLSELKTCIFERMKKKN